MPKSIPKYSKLIVVTGSYDMRDAVIWLYQRLTYCKLPVWTPELDLAYLSSPGSTDLAIERASYVISVLPAKLETGISSIDNFEVSIARRYGRNILWVKMPGSEVPTELSTELVYDFTSYRESTFQRLLRYIQPEDMSYPSYISEDGKWYLEQAENDRPLEIEIFSYLKIMQDLEHDQYRLRAIIQLGRLRVQSGIIRAALYDPSSRVRAEAAWVLFQMKQLDVIDDLNLVGLIDPSPTVRLYSQVASRLMTNSTSVSVYEWLQNIRQNIGGPIYEPDQDNLYNHNLNLNIHVAADWLFKFVSDQQASHSQGASHSSNSRKLSHDIFISYARKDAESFALDLANKLRHFGFRVWIDENLQPGSKVWVHEIENAIEQAKVCLFVISPEVKNSEWIAKEYFHARQYQKVIIPIVYIEAPFPMYINTEQGIRGMPSFTRDAELAFTILTSALKDRLEPTSQI